MSSVECVPPYSVSQEGDLYALCDAEGRKILPYKERAIKKLGDNLFALEIQSGWQIYRVGHGILTTHCVTSIAPFENGVAEVLSGEETWTIDTEGKSQIRDVQVFPSGLEIYRDIGGWKLKYQGKEKSIHGKEFKIKQVGNLIYLRDRSPKSYLITLTGNILYQDFKKIIPLGFGLLMLTYKKRRIILHPDGSEAGRISSDITPAFHEGWRYRESSPRYTDPLSPVFSLGMETERFDSHPPLQPRGVRTYRSELGKCVYLVNLAEEKTPHEDYPSQAKKPYNPYYHILLTEDFQILHSRKVDTITPTSEGAWFVQLSTGRTYVYDSLWQLVSPLAFDYIGPFVNGEANALYQSCALRISTRGRILLEECTELPNGDLLGKKLGLCGIESPEGEVRLPFIYSRITPYDYGSFLVERDTQLSTDDKHLQRYFGLYDERYEELLPIIYSQIVPLGGGYLLIRYDEVQSLLQLRDGELHEVNDSPILPYLDEYVRNYRPGITPLANADGNLLLIMQQRLPDGNEITQFGSLYGILSPEGLEIIPFEYTSISPLGDQLLVVDAEGNQGLLDLDYEWTLLCIYRAIRQLTPDIWAARYQGEWQLFGRDGSELLYEDEERLLGYDEGWRIIIDEGEIGLMDGSGYVRIIPEESLPDGYMLGTKCGYWGIERCEDRHEVLPFEYVNITHLGDSGLFLLERNPGSFGLLDKDYSMLLPCNYTGIKLNDRDQVLAYCKTGFYTFLLSELRDRSLQADN